ncbi:MAG: M13 family metallopeptidase [Polyangiaceae bacterium]
MRNALDPRRGLLLAASSLALAYAGVTFGCTTKHVPTPPPPDPPPDTTATASASTTASNPPTPKKPQKAGKLDDQGLSLSAMDRNVDPCDDFYKFACGGWEASTEIPADRSRWSRSFSEIDQRNEADLKTILESAVPKRKEESTVGKLGRFYAACMDTAAIDKAGAKPLANILASIQKVKNPESAIATIAKLHTYGVWAFFDISSGQDSADATKMIALMDQNGLGLPDRDYYLSNDSDKTKIRDQYKAHVEAMFKLNGLDDKAAKAAMEHVLRIETALATASKSREERRDPKAMYNPVDRAGLAAMSPDVAWDAYFKGVGFADLAALSVSAPKFFKEIGAILKSESPEALRTYLTWMVLHYSAPRLSSKFDAEDFAMSKVLTGQKVQRDRWKRCIDATDEALGELLAQPFVDLRFGGQSKQGAEMLVSEIAKAMRGRLDELEWMDQGTRDKARAKLDAMAYLIGYPKKWKTYDFAVKDSYFDNVLAGAAFRLKDSLSKVGKPVDRDEWFMTPPTVNAYYDPQKNQMVFPAGILQPPFYNAKASDVVNLGAMGMVVGHELTHGFDDEGSQFDKDGNLANWWSPKTEEIFTQKGQCVANQYSAYEVLPGVKLNGKLTLGENIADAGGVKLAFRAYRNIRASAAEEVVADGFTEDQQFFISVGQIWCSKYRDESTRLLAQVDPHSHPHYRVNGPLSQLPEFAAAFQCKEGKKMAVKNACTVW